MRTHRARCLAALLAGLVTSGCTAAGAATGTTRPTVTVTTTVTSAPATATTAPLTTAAAAHTSAPSAGGTAATAPPDPTFRRNGFVIPRRGDDWDWKNASYPSTCLTWDKPPVSRHLRGGVGVLPYDFQLQLARVKRGHLRDGHTYALVALICQPGAGKSLTQVYAFAIRPGALTYLGQPVRFNDDVYVTEMGTQDGEGFVLSADGWTRTAPTCCPDQDATFFVTLSPTRVTDVGRQNGPRLD